MSYQSFVKSQFATRTIDEILTSPPTVLLGVSDAVAAALAAAGVHTVFDLAVSVVFDGAARVEASGDDPRSVMRRFGRAPSSLVNSAVGAVDAAELPFADLTILAALDAPTAAGLRQALSLKTVRDAAYWPPFLAAKTIMLEAYNPTLGLDIDPEAPPNLIPRSGEFGTERHLYSSIVMFPGQFAAPAVPLEGVLFDITAPSGVGFDTVRFGARLTYAHIWTPLGVAKGHLLHSVPLAPGESTNVAVIDWTNKSSASTQQSLSESERLDSTNERARTVSQIANSVANEFTSGASVTTTESTSIEGGVGGIAGFFLGSQSGAANQQVATTHTVSTGDRNIATALQQNIQDATQQVSSALRSERAASVSEINQGQTENLATRSLTNYNHMHALTVQYYEMVQVYETETRLEGADRCIFLPMRPIDFQDERNIARYLQILKASALDGVTRRLLAELEDNLQVGYTMRFGGNSRAPSDRPTSPFGGIFPFPSLAQLFGGQLQARAWAAARAGFIGFTGNLDTVTLDVRLELNNVRWSASRSGPPPLTPISAIRIKLEDGTDIDFPQSAESTDPPTVVSSALINGPLSFGRIVSISMIVDQTYDPAPYPFIAEGHLISLEFAVGRGADAHWLDASFIVLDKGAISILSNEPIYTFSSPPALAELGHLLNENGLYYSQQVWLREDPQARLMQLAPYRIAVDEGKTVNLVDYLAPEPLQVVGNYLVYRFTYEDAEEWLNWVQQHVDPVKAVIDTVAVPTGGVFAEAVLGRANSAEKLDITRFFDWADSPPPQPPAIQPLKAGGFTPTAAPAIGTFGKPVVSIQAPLALPEPAGLSTVLTAITTSDAFRNMSGLASSGAAANEALDASGKAATGALQAAGTALATTLSALADALSARKPAEKTLSEAGAAINKKADAVKAEAGKPASEKDTPPTAAEAAKQKLVTKSLQDVGLDTTPAPAPATDSASPGTSTDPALLNSALVTEPTFANVPDFVVMLQLVADADLPAVLARRFGNLAKDVDPLQKYQEFVAAVTEQSTALENPGRILHAAAFVKNGVLPDDDDFAADDVAGVRAAEIDIAGGRAAAVAKTVNASSSATEAVSKILSACAAQGVADLDAVSYVLATAHHESAMGKYMTEIATGLSTDTVFTRDAYFFNAIPGTKSSYNQLDGNVKAGTALQKAGKISSAPDITAWNGSVYPVGQPDTVKIAARACDFYVFIGRGFVQLTGRANYQKFSGLPATGNVDLLGHPERATDPAVAATVLTLGMNNGMFRPPHKLADYDLPAGWDATNARDIVNADKATTGATIREIAKRYKAALVQITKLDQSKPII